MTLCVILLHGDSDGNMGMYVCTYVLYPMVVMVITCMSISPQEAGDGRMSGFIPWLC